tara:strand:- start:1270 stop:1980 length:711 start_codon:yes stop_codon:yes gene_type:complete
MRKNYAVIAAGGLGTRLKDFKDNKHTKVLIDINELSMISTQIKQLKSWGFENFIVITNPDFNDLIKNDVYENFENLNVNFVVQESPKGIADALSYAEPFVLDNSLITFILGDNFFGNNPLINLNFEQMDGAHIFAINVDNPEEFGVMEMDSNNKLINIHEKPKQFISSLAVVGIYIYDKSCFEYIKQLEPSERGELEITDLNKIYLSNNLIDFTVIDSWWVDAGTEERINKLKKLI